MKEPVDHIERPNLPWREDPGMTECGMNKRSVKLLTREQFKKRVKDWGSQRTAIATCMNCIHTAERWGTWDDDPRQAISREVQWERAEWLHSGNPHGTRLRDELRAVAVLVERHKDEFEALRKGFSCAMDFNDAVADKTRKAN